MKIFNLNPPKNFIPPNFWLQVSVLDLDWSLTTPSLSFGLRLEFDNIFWSKNFLNQPHFFIAKLRPSPSSAKLAWLSIILISSRYVAEDPPDMWQKIAQICGRRSPRYVAEDHPDMWQKIRKSIFLSSLAKNISQILSFGFEGKTLYMPGSLSEPNQILTRLGL